MKIMNLYKIICLIVLMIVENEVNGQQSTHIELEQGNIIGLKVFPESSRTSIFAFLGIPYAQPPIGNLRFSPPRPHPNWRNTTLLVNNFKPLCPQIQNSIYDENPKRMSSRSTQMMNEDCLYLNIWAPEDAFKFGNLPVLVIITGEEMSFDWEQNRPSGLDLSTEGIVVVVVQYRMNIFGWLGINTYEFPGNLGLADQELAFKWIQSNIDKFGGNPNQVTLLGHGTSGFSLGLIHLFSPKAPNLFSKAILMSGSVISHGLSTNQNLSYQLIEKLGCQEDSSHLILRCLRTKSVTDLLKSFESVYRNGNYSKLLGPVLDHFLPEPKQYVPRTTNEVLKKGDFAKIPIMMGICTNEGSFIHDYWIDLAREGYEQLKNYIYYTVVPKILRKYDLVESNQVLKTIKWKYFQMTPRYPSHLLNSLQRIISEGIFESSFYNTIELISRSFETNSTLSSNMYVYAFQTNFNSMDIRGKLNLFGGASHSSDLPFLMGPSLFQSIARRRFSTAEDKLSRNLRQYFGNFVKLGNPTPGRLYDAWSNFDGKNKFIKILGDSLTEDNTEMYFERNLDKIDQLLEKSAGSGTVLTFTNQDLLNPYELHSMEKSKTKSANYYQNLQDFQYFNHLKKVFSFWNTLLPSIRKSDNPYDDKLRNGRESVMIGEIYEYNRYRYAFFWMLGLVCFLLAILGVCIYILKKQNQTQWFISDL